MATPVRLSKSQYVMGLQCDKALWLYRHRKDLIPPTPPGLQQIFDQGQDIGRLAWKRFPKGRLIAENHRQAEQALKSTAEAIAAGVGVLYEAGAVFDGVLVRSDILQKNKDGSWDLIEVKSSSGVKDVYLHDLAIQRYVLEGAGFKVRKTILMHVNTAYVRRGAIDPAAFFSLADETVAVKTLLKAVPKEVARLHKITALKSSPAIEIGPHCDTPYECRFKDHCWEAIPEYSIYDIVRLRGQKIALLKDRGILEVADVPDDFPLSDSQRLQVQCEKTGRTHIDRAAVAALLEELEYPLHFLDFETVNPAVPPYDGLRPFQQLPFQASIHVLAKKGNSVQHEEFLDDGKQDPRPGLTSFLTSSIGPKGAVIAYNAGFEGNCLKELAATDCKRAKQLLSMKARLWDLADPFRKAHYVHPDFQGSWSIKKVLPVLVPTMTYDGMPIHDGGGAQGAYMQMLSGELSAAAARKIMRQLLDYCGQDTLAMVELLRHLELVK